jgi:hypothetical protein
MKGGPEEVPGYYEFKLWQLKSDTGTVSRLLKMIRV